MRILHVSPFHERAIRMGGVAVGTGSLIRAQARAGADVTVFATDVGLDRETEKLEDMGGVVCRCFHVRKGMPFFFSGEMIHAFEELVPEFDIIHIHGLWNVPVNWAAKCAIQTGIPFALSPRGMLNQWAFRYRGWKKSPIWYLFQRRVVASAAVLIFTTEEERRQAAALIDHPQTAVVPFGIGEMRGAPQARRGNFRARLGINPEVPLLVYIGRIHPIKGLGVLLEAIQDASAKIPNLQIVMAGPDEGGHQAELHTQAARAGIADRVHWVGLVDGREKWALLEDADLFMFVSFSENFGLAAIEAMSVGTAVVVGQGVNIATLVREYDAGWVVATERVPIVKAIHESFSNPALRRARAQRAMKLVADQFDADLCARRVLDIYHQCLPPGSKRAHVGSGRQMGGVA